MRNDLLKEENENRVILNAFAKLIRYSKPFVSKDDSKIIKKAFKISFSAHKDMRRKSGEPYILHPISVALICVKEIGLGTTSIVAALLHDVVEDTDIGVDVVVYTATADDSADISGGVTFSLEDEGLGFSIDSNSGVVTTNADFAADYEDAQSQSFTVVRSEEHTSETPVTL